MRGHATVSPPSSSETGSVAARATARAIAASTVTVKRGIFTVTVLKKLGGDEPRQACGPDHRPP